MRLTTAEVLFVWSGSQLLFLIIKHWPPKRGRK